MGSCTGASVGVVAESVDMHPAVGIGVMASQIPADCGRAGLGVLVEVDGARDLRVTAEECHW